MKIDKFSEMVASKEKGKKQVNIVQIKEILKVINKLTGGIFYAVIKAL